MHAVITRDVTKCYGKHFALEPITLELGEGEFLGIVGQNGVGKTTFLRILSGTLQPSKGEVRLFGHPVPGIKQLANLVGVVHQDTHIPNLLTIDEVLKAEARLRRLKPSAVNEQMERMQLTHVRHRCLRDLSKGMRRKTVIVRALLHKPRILILDEPTVGLDPSARRGIWEYLLREKEQGLTCLVSTHYLDEVRATCEKAIVLYQRGPSVAHHLAALNGGEHCRQQLVLRFQTDEPDNQIKIHDIAEKSAGRLVLAKMSSGTARLRLQQGEAWLDTWLLQLLLSQDLRLSGILMENEPLEEAWREFLT
uniref:ABC-type multidrug transport system, ATPase component n=1 Tax=Candidatus Kentrum sp. MB TaxID=2138164 RepID=A0A450XK18_9GAMM|nr:MAG: ABC-type multidrug transport system, ATPase component [Candidatus Kentron sp. MB]VFK29663.1 MAG: ABC-type multidrug transport system, ATPase component [Candidatus Kentron sp. MB]VFK74862.1 MAG: ABC-type multidrug transport system, ATPase component [Candidatus Kentron sp. MB]